MERCPQASSRRDKGTYLACLLDKSIGVYLAPPNASHPSQPVRQVSNPDSGITYEADLEFLDHVRRVVGIK